MVILDVEDYVQPKDLKAALIEGGLWDRVWVPPKHMTAWPSLLDMVSPKPHAANQTERPRRVILMSEKHPDVYRWLLGTYKVSEETPFTFTSTSQFNCAAQSRWHGKAVLHREPLAAAERSSRPRRGGHGELREDAHRGPYQAVHRTSGTIARARSAVDFTAIGDLYKTVNLFNAAIAKESKVTPRIDQAARLIRVHGTRQDVADIDVLRRLPKISEKRARKLLGPLADTLKTPADLSKMVVEGEDPDATTTTTVPPTTASPTTAPEASASP